LLKQKKHAVFSWGVDYNYLTNPDQEEISKIKNELNLQEKNQVVLSYRNHMALYNHHTLVKSIPLIIKEYPNTKFVFTRGSHDAQYISQTRQLVKDLNIGSNFLLLDHWLSSEELRALINIADINVSIPTRDGLPATLFEIMSTKAIPVISDLQNYYPFFSDKVNGFYLRHLNDHQELAHIIKKTLKNISHLKKTLSPVNNSYIQKYQNWENQSKIFLDFYH
jgi:glycosyltransferase involved in cell wall biosynthesis